MSSNILDPRRPLELRRQAVANLFDFLVKGGVAGSRRRPPEGVRDGAQRKLHRYEPWAGVTTTGPPVLLTPPLGAPATCFDLRRGCSVAEHLVQGGRRSYLVDYGSISF